MKGKKVKAAEDVLRNMKELKYKRIKVKSMLHLKGKQKEATVPELNESLKKMSEN